MGRPNVGKSTLFNVLAGDMISIVKDTPGVTRDRIYADCTWLDKAFTLIDTGGIGARHEGCDPGPDARTGRDSHCDGRCNYFIVDVRQGLTDSDSKVADILRKSKKAGGAGRQQGGQLPEIRQ